MPYASITGTGYYVPEKLMTNAEFDRRLGEPVDEWLRERVGIHQRYFMAEDERTSDLALNAARQALAQAHIAPDALDLIILATDTPDYISPGTSSVIQHKLGAVNAGNFDVNCACAGWVTALDSAARYIQTDPDYRHILVIGAYGMSRYLDLDDKYTATLFADGGGAVVLSASDSPGFLAGSLLAQGAYHDAMGIYSGGTARPATPAVVDDLGKPRVEFVRKVPSSFNTENWPPLIEKSLKKADMPLDDVDFFIFTQLNLRTIEATMAALNQPLSKTHWIMDKWGYTGSACIPMALADAYNLGKLHRGDKLLLCASGGGLMLAAALFEWTL